VSVREVAMASEPVVDGQKILVVDDEASICTFVANVLEDHGYLAVTTSDPRAAVDLVRREHPVLVVADISMPEMDGYALIGALQRDPSTCTCPVLFITGRIGFSERMKAFRCGARDFLAKPFAPETLLAKVERVLKDVGLSH
jgi:twitching motility two-component system response regulator PilH